MTSFKLLRNLTTAALAAVVLVGVSPSTRADHEHGPHEAHQIEDVRVIMDCEDEDDCDGARMVKVMMASGDGDVQLLGVDDGEAIDISDMEVGETRYSTTDDGNEIAITREEDGYLIDVDGEEIHVNSIGGGDHMRVLVTEGEGGNMAFGHGMHAVSGSGGSWTADDGSVVMLKGHNAAFGGHGGHDANTVTISGLGDLDEDQRQAIIDALRDAGVDKDVRFADKMGFHVITTGEGDGEATIDVDVQDDGTGTRKVFIKKIKTGEEDE